MLSGRWWSGIGAAVAFAIVAEPAVAEQKWGMVKGRFIYGARPPATEHLDIKNPPAGCPNCKREAEELVVDAESRGIRNIVVYLIDVETPIHPKYDALRGEPAVLDNWNCAFEPHVLALWTEQPLEIRNSDGCGHNAACSPKKDGPFNPLLQPGDVQRVKLTQSQTLPQPVMCSIHPWMKAYVLPRATPYVAVSNALGEFEIADLPVGKHEFQIWHERAGYLLASPDWVAGRRKGVATWTIEEGKTLDLGKIDVEPSLLAPK